VTTILRASPRRFVSTPAIDRVVSRALRYLQSGYSLHLRGPAGTGKTTLALHLADLMARPIMLVYGDDEFKTSDLIGGQTGYTRKKVVDNFIHSVVKVEDELRQTWVDSRLTLACREGFTLVYDEFNRSRPEVNNVLLSALEEKLLVLPPSNNRSEYLRVNPNFRAIFTSNPEEYVGVHQTQDALMDRLITINIPEPDELSQQEIVLQKTECDRPTAASVVRLVKTFRAKTNSDKTSGLRSSLMLAKICQEHAIPASPENAEFRDLCADVLLSRAPIKPAEATPLLWESLNQLLRDDLADVHEAEAPERVTASVVGHSNSNGKSSNGKASNGKNSNGKLSNGSQPELDLTGEDVESTVEIATLNLPVSPAQQILNYLQQSQGAKLAEIEKALNFDRIQTVDLLKQLTEQGKITQRYRLYMLKEGA
jgi:gas vesicle protein GvpN